MRLYERFMLNEIDENQYMNLKEKINMELDSLNRVYNAILSKANQLQVENKEKAKLLNTAKIVSSEAVLTKRLVDTLIDKVHIYPDDVVEIDWKIREFYDLTV